MNIRRAKEGDMETIQRLLLQVAMVHHRGRPDLFQAGTRKYTDDELLQIIHDDSRPIFVAEEPEAEFSDTPSASSSSQTAIF